jgi:aldehyde dehydrogenase (NAD+)
MHFSLLIKPLPIFRSAWTDHHAAMLSAFAVSRHADAANRELRSRPKKRLFARALAQSVLDCVMIRGRFRASGMLQESYMRDMLKFYIDGEWVEPLVANPFEVFNPATEEVCGRISLGSAADVDRAVAAALRAAPDYAATSREERIALLEKILAAFAVRHDEIATAIMEEMGAPWKLAKHAQAASGPQHIQAAIEVLKTFAFEERHGTTLIVKEPIGVCALITPWNWPINQIAVKVAPALAAGCTMVLKPSEIAPFDAMIFAEVLHDAGVPAGVFNLVNGDGPGVGTALASHRDVAMVSFTGSTRAGVSVAQNAAPSVKRVAQELGGKSANIILDDANFEKAVSRGASECFENSGQSCNAPTRMLVPKARVAEAAEIAAKRAATTTVGDPRAEETRMGPVVSEMQWNKVQKLIQKGIDEGATLAAGGTGRPDGLDKGFFVKPTVFADVSHDMTIAREEIFGPVLSIMPYEDEDDAVRIANDSPYGLSGYVSSANLESARRVAGRLRTGMVHINNASLDAMAPFGGYKQSGNGREWGAHGMDEFLEVKSVYGYDMAS